MSREQRTDEQGGLWREAATVHWIWITLLASAVSGGFAWFAPEGPETPEREVRTTAVVVLVVLMACGLRLAHRKWKARSEFLGELRTRTDLRERGWKSPAQQAAEELRPEPEQADPRGRILFLAAVDELAALAKSDDTTPGELLENYRVLTLLIDRTRGPAAVNDAASAFRPLRDQVREGRLAPQEAAEQMLEPFRQGLLTGESPDLSSFGGAVPEWSDWRERVLFSRSRRGGVQVVRAGDARRPQRQRREPTPVAPRRRHGVRRALSRRDPRSPAESAEEDAPRD